MPLLIKTAGFENFLDPSGGAYLKALIMGDHGVGKTPFAATWPKPLIADCEKGVLSVASLGTPYAEIKTSSDMQELLDMLRREGMKPAASRKYQTLVIDTVDTYQRKLIQERLKAERKEALSGWADWGWLDGKMQALLESVLNLPMNVVVNMHTKDTSEDDGETQVLVQKARLKGDIKDAIFQDFDLIGHMEQSYVAGTGDKKGERVRVRQIRWHSEPKYPALRDRSNKLPRFTDVTFTPDDYWAIFNAITSGLDDLPKSVELDSLETTADAEPAPADTKGGPVTEPEIPAAKGKRAPAKKAGPAAKKAEPKPEPKDSDGGTGEGPNVVAGKDFTPPEPEPAIDPWTGKPVDPNNQTMPEAPVDETPAATDVDEAAAAAAEQLAIDQLGAQEITEEDTPLPVVAPEETPVITTEPAEQPKPEPAKTEPAKTEAKVTKHCGDQPASMVGKYPAVEGCGVELNQENAGKAQIAMMKFRTYLCNEDFDKRQASVA